MHGKRKRGPGELAFAILLLSFSAASLWQAWRIAGFSSWSSPGALPMFAALVMVITGLMIVRGTARAHSNEPAEGQTSIREFFNRITPPAMIWFTVLITLYMIALEPLGFILSSFLYLVCAMFTLGSRRIIYNMIISALSLALIYVVFQTAFSVVLPGGILEELFR